MESVAEFTKKVSQLSRRMAPREAYKKVEAQHHRMFSRRRFTGYHQYKVISSQLTVLKGKLGDPPPGVY